MSTAITSTSEVEVYVPESIIFTDSAALKVWQLINEEGNPSLMLRVSITGGGCSGFQYGFSFEETIVEGDTVVSKQVDEEEEGGDEGGGTVKLLVDPMSFQYLVGAVIDYVEDLEGERFVIRNPNAETTCGCGSSFSM